MVDITMKYNRRRTVLRQERREFNQEFRTVKRSAEDSENRYEDFDYETYSKHNRNRRLLS
jgi:hypothetical protein